MSTDEMDDLFEQEEMFDVEEIEQPLFDDEDADVLAQFAEYNLTPEDRRRVHAYRVLGLAQDLYVHRRGLNPQQSVEQARTFFDDSNVKALIDD